MDAYGTHFDAELAAFSAGVIGGGLSAPVLALIERAGTLRDQPEAAQPLLELARGMAPRHAAPLIALYRFHFYGHRLEQARAVGLDALAVARTALGHDFGDEAPSDEAARYDAAVRFYLFTLKGLAYLNLRLDEFDEARLLLAELRRLDPADHVGAALLSHVLARHEAGGETGMDYPVRGWGARP
jgi:hypothetical protein